MYSGQQGVGQHKFNQLLSRFQPPPPNPYQNHKAGAGMYNNRSNFMMQQRGYQAPQYNDYNNRYNDMMYDNEAISDDSSDGMHDDPNAEQEAEDPEVNLGSYQSAANNSYLMGDAILSSHLKLGNHQMHDGILPEIPDIPAMAQFADVNMKAEEEELGRHVGFVIKLNSRLVQLNAECRALYPQIAQGLIDSKLKEFQEKEYVALVEEKVALEKKCNEYEQQIQNLMPVENVNVDLQSEVKELRQLTENYAEKVDSSGNISQKDYREMISSESRQYVNEIQKQLDTYREQVIHLTQQSQNCMRAIQNSVQHQKTTQESIQNAYNELKPLGEHLQFLEENQLQQNNAENNDENSSKSKKLLESKIENLEEKIHGLEFKNKALQNEIVIVKQSQKNVQSEKLANKAQVEQHLEFKYKEQINSLQDELSKIMIERLEIEDKYAQKQKDEQERADKYRAKYESVKQHVKTLEMQKVEYTRVNMQLRQQNNEFRQMITTLQNQLKMISMQQQHAQQEQQAPLLSQQQQRLIQLQQQQQNLMRQQNMLNNKHHQHSHSFNPQPADDNNNQNQNNANNHKHANSYDPQQMQMMQAQMQMDGNQHRKLWGKQTKELSEKGTKKRVLIEWHFVTSDSQPHTVVLQHTQDTKPKTRRMLWVDGVEKYNNKSSASSFRIEIDKDVVVVSIDQLDQYQYRLTINNASYQDAFKLWESRQKR